MMSLVDTSEAHGYQIAWIVVGGGATDVGQIVRLTGAVAPAGIALFKTAPFKLLPGTKDAFFLASDRPSTQRCG